MTAIIALPDYEALNLLYKKKWAKDTCLLSCQQFSIWLGRIATPALTVPGNPGKAQGRKQLHI
jgi:hypothetical protein